MIKKKLSIVDIANKLNISKTTVSFILNGRAREKRISEELVERVLKFVKEVGYKPNSLAKSLRTGKSHIIGLMVENIADPFFANIARYIEDRAYKNGYRIIYCSTDNDADKTRDLIAMFRDRHVDGYIIAPPVGVEEDIAELLKDDLPVVLFDRYFPGIDCSYVVTDNLHSTYTATEYLVEQGYKKIAFITLQSHQTQMQARLDGYKEALEQNNLHPYIKEVIFNQESKYMSEPIADFLKNNKDLDAIIFGTNRIGTCGLKVIHSMGIHVPDDVAVISFDDHDVFELYSPSITAIAQPVEEIAANTINILLSKLDSSTPNADNKKITLQNDLIYRDSSQINNNLSAVK
ncbi:MAG: LacI family DNA-binding transcriptional regulator [Sphingobacteriales bacterium]